MTWSKDNGKFAKDAANSANAAAIKASDDTLVAITTMQNDVKEYKDAFVHKKEYSNVVRYQKNNEVEYNGSTYRAKKDVLGYPPPHAIGDSNDYWQLVARKGVDATTNELTGVWRGPTPPENVRILWWKDMSVAKGYMTYIQVGAIQPSNPDHLWLKKGAAN